MALLTFSPMLAEISDKMPGVVGIRISSVGLAAIAIGCGRDSRWTFVVTVLLAGWLALAVWREFVADTFFRAAITSELGHGCLIQSVCAGFVPLLAVLTCGAHALKRLRAWENPKTALRSTGLPGGGR